MPSSIPTVSVHEGTNMDLRPDSMVDLITTISAHADRGAGSPHRPPACLHFRREDLGHRPRNVTYPSPFIHLRTMIILTQRTDDDGSERELLMLND